MVLCLHMVLLPLPLQLPSYLDQLHLITPLTSLFTLPSLTATLLNDNNKSQQRWQCAHKWHFIAAL